MRLASMRTLERHVYISFGGCTHSNSDYYGYK